MDAGVEILCIAVELSVFDNPPWSRSQALWKATIEGVPILLVMLVREG